MDRATVIANWGRQPGEPMSDEQRRAMFWRMSQGGGGTWSQRPTAQDYNNTLLGSAFGLTLGALGAGTDYGLGIVDGATAASYLPKIKIVPQGRTPEEVKATLDALKASGAMETGAWAKFKAAAKGFASGAWEGIINDADALTMELITPLHEKALEGDSEWSKRLAMVGAGAAHWAAGAGIYAKLGAAFQAAKVTATGGKLAAAWNAVPGAISISKHSKLLTAIGGFMAQDGIEEYRKGRALNPYWDKALAMTAQGAGFVGSMAGIEAAGQYVGGAMKAIPVSTKLTPAAKKWMTRFLTPPAKPLDAKFLKTATPAQITTALKSAADKAHIKGLISQAKSMTPGRRLSLLGAAKVLLTGVDKSVKAVVGTALKPVAYLTPQIVKNGLKKLHSGYTAFSEFTGSTIKEIVNMPKTLSKLRKASQLVKQGAALNAKAASMKAIDAAKVYGPVSYSSSSLSHPGGLFAKIGLISKTQKTGYVRQAAGQLNRAAEEKILGLNKLGTASAKRVADAIKQKSDEVVNGLNKLGVLDWNKVPMGAKVREEAEKSILKSSKELERLLSSKFGATTASKRFLADASANLNTAIKLETDSKVAQAALRSEASRLGRQAGYLRANAQSALQKAAYVAGISSAVTAVEELGVGPKGSISEHFGMGKGIAEYQKDHYAAYQRGETLEHPVDTERPLLGKIAVGAAASTGNPIEKLFRSNWAGEQSEMGAYRAKLQIVDEQEKAGILTKAQAKAKRDEYAKDKPYKMQGRGIWDIATAFGSYTNWKVKEAIDKAKRTSFEKVIHVRDGDTLITTKDVYRGSAFNTPESGWVHGNPPEPLGQEAKDNMKRLAPEGSTIGVVTDSHPKAAGRDEKYDRAIASFTTMPAGLKWTLKVRYLRRAAALFGTDIGKAQIKAGLADMRYGMDVLPSGKIDRGLSGTTDMDAIYDKARQKPKAKGKGIWNPELLASSPALREWVGQQEGPAAIRAAQWAKDNPGKPMPQTSATDFNTHWGSGLMWTGNSRAFSAMPRVGLWAAQLWNLSLAFRGVQEHTEKAQARAGAPAYTRTEQRDTGIKTPEQIRIDSLMESIRAEYGR